VIPIEHVVMLSGLLFTIGAVGALLRRNLVVMLMSIVLMLNAAALALIGFNRVWSTGPGGEPLVQGQVFALAVIAIAAALVAVGLGILVALARNRNSMNVEDSSLLKW
jgi:NADH-quinone oxidoreductase subunit K